MSEIEVESERERERKGEGGRRERCFKTNRFYYDDIDRGIERERERR